VIWWPRLYDLLPKETKDKIEHTMNELYILLNFSSLSIIFYIMCVVAVLYTGVSSVTLPELFEATIRYISAGALAVFISGFINRLAVFSASAYTEQLRSAYDLHRFSLLDQMRITLPKNSTEEFELWKNLGELIVLGHLSLKFQGQNYDRQSVGKKQRTSATRKNVKKVAQSQKDE
jgi:hypothetical protein